MVLGSPEKVEMGCSSSLRSFKRIGMERRYLQHQSEVLQGEKDGDKIPSTLTWDPSGRYGWRQGTCSAGLRSSGEIRMETRNL